MWTWRLDLEFESWIAPMRTPATFVAAIKALQIAAPDDVRHYFTVRENGFFTIDIMVIETVACWGQLPR